ncbi:MAG: hypothetical protein J3K34DRAFT_481220 [Monoraphidium minutum]|nr:MAG: hypothetical protein J3K34DRAFT_481220 [Monoraphidium minutum]
MPPAHAGGAPPPPAPRAAPPACEPRPLGARELLDVCQWVWDSHDAARLSLDAHIGACLATRGMVAQDDQTFVSQVVFGLHRYRRFLGSFLDGFFHVNSGKALRTDATRYRVLTYLAAFRFEELGARGFRRRTRRDACTHEHRHTHMICVASPPRRLVEAQDAQKAAVLLAHLFDGAALREHARGRWLQDYDAQASAAQMILFVDDTIARLEACGEQCAGLLAALHDQVYAKAAAAAAGGSAPESAARRAPRRAATAPAPFHLSQPRPKPPPARDAPPPPPAPRPAPPRRGGPTREEVALEAARAENRAAAARAHAAAAPFWLRVLERPADGPRLREEADAAVAAELAVRPRARPAPPPPGAEVKLNAAAVLREEAVYRKKQAEEARELQRFESELRDRRDFESWRAAALAADAAAEAARVDALKREMSAAAGAALRARGGLLRSRLRAGADHKAAAAARAAAAAAAAGADAGARAARVKGVQAARGGAAEAAAAAAEARKLAAEDVRRRGEADAQARAEAEARDMAEKRDIILRLRALAGGQAASGGGSRGGGGRADETAAAERGMNEQMSLLELQERQAVLQRRQKEEEEERRARILSEKQGREAAMAGKVAQLQRAFARKASAASAAAGAAAAAAVRADDRALCLAARLEAKRGAAAAERARVAAEEKRVRHQQMQSAAGAAAVEAARLRDLRDGSERVAGQRQLEARRDAEAADATKAREEALRRAGKRQERAAHADARAAYDRTAAALARQSGADAERGLASRRAAAAAAHARETQAWQGRARGAGVGARAAAGEGSGATAITARLAALGRGEGPLY